MSVEELAVAHGIEMPITREVVRSATTVATYTAIRALMGRSRKAE